MAGQQKKAWMYSYSDEEVAWGPISKEELLKGKPKSLISSRNSASVIEMSGSHYFTPNQTFQSTNNEDFLNKLSEIVDDNLSTSSYTTADEGPPVQSEDTITNIIKNAGPEFENLSRIQESLIDSFRETSLGCLSVSSEHDKSEESCSCIVLSDDDSLLSGISTLQKKISSSFEVNKFLGSVLEESSVILIEDDEDESYHEEIIVCKKERESCGNENQIQQITEESFKDSVETSEDGFGENQETSKHGFKECEEISEDGFKENQEISEHKFKECEEISEDGFKENRETSEDGFKGKEPISVNGYEKNKQKIEPNFEFLINEIVVENKPTTEDQFEETQAIKQSYEINKEERKTCELISNTEEPSKEIQKTEESLEINEEEQMRNQDKITFMITKAEEQIPEQDEAKNYHQLNSSKYSNISESSEILSEEIHFNDTLEEMEMLLKQGLNYKMPLEEDVSLQISNSSRNSIITGSFSNNAIEKIEVKSKIPHKKQLAQPKLTPKQDIFKVPSSSTKKRTTPTGPLKTPQYLKNIVSPVGVYIKNTPTAPLKQNIKPKMVTKLFVPKSPAAAAQKENREVTSAALPNVIYKPSGRSVTDHGKTINLPRSIKTMVPVRVVTKHESRIINQGRGNHVDLERKLSEDENLTQIEDNQDISVLVKHEAFIK